MGSLAVAARTGPLPSGAIERTVDGRPCLTVALGCRAIMRLAKEGSLCACACVSHCCSARQEESLQQHCTLFC